MTITGLLLQHRHDLGIAKSSHFSSLSCQVVKVQLTLPDNWFPIKESVQAAIATARAVGGVLLIAKLDRLSRNASFILALRNSRVQFACCDMTDANTLTVGLFTVIAQHERETISQRTKDAPKAKKARGAQLGTPANLMEDVRRLGDALAQCSRA